MSVLDSFSPALRAALKKRAAEIAGDQSLRAEIEQTVGDPMKAHAERCRDDFAYFVASFWIVVEPSVAFLSAPHIDAICQHLQTAAEGRITRLLINVPPGHAKSLLVAVLWPAWMWLRNPGWRVLIGSYALDLAIRDSVRSRDLITSPEYEAVKRALGATWKLTTDQNVKSNFANDAKGFRMALSVGSKATGFRGDCLIFDDLLNAKEPDKITREAIEEANSWWKVTMSSRLNDLRKGVKIGIMQRLAENDPCDGLIRSRRPDGSPEYDLVALPSEYDPDLYESLGRADARTSIGWQDHRTEPGELLFPALFPQVVLDEAKSGESGMGPTAYAAQHGQRPMPSSGGFFQRTWWRFWVPEGVPMPAPVVVKTADGSLFECPQVRLPPLISQTISADLTFKDTLTADFVAIQVWAYGAVEGFRQSRFLLDQLHKKMDFVATLRAFRAFCELWPEAGRKLVEDKANGPALMSMLHDEIPGIVPVEPLGGKEARANACAPFIESGHVYLPHPEIFPWVKVFLAEVTAFPKGRFKDDQVDAMTQFLNRKRVAVA